MRGWRERTERKKELMISIRRIRWLSKAPSRGSSVQCLVLGNVIGCEVEVDNKWVVCQVQLRGAALLINGLRGAEGRLGRNTHLSPRDLFLPVWETLRIRERAAHSRLGLNEEDRIAPPGRARTWASAGRMRRLSNRVGLVGEQGAGHSTEKRAPFPG